MLLYCKSDILTRRWVPNPFDSETMSPNLADQAQSCVFYSFSTGTVLVRVPVLVATCSESAASAAAVHGASLLWGSVAVCGVPAEAIAGGQEWHAGARYVLVIAAQLPRLSAPSC